MDSSLPADVRELVDDLLALGPYESEATVLREALRLLKQRDQLKREIHEAISELDSGAGMDGDEVFRELREKAARLAARHV